MAQASRGGLARAETCRVLLLGNMCGFGGWKKIWNIIYIHFLITTLIEKGFTHVNKLDHQLVGLGWALNWCSVGGRWSKKLKIFEQENASIYTKRRKALNNIYRPSAIEILSYTVKTVWLEVVGELWIGTLFHLQESQSLHAVHIKFIE